MRRFNDRKIYEDADCVEIAEAIGMKMQKRGIAFPVAQTAE